MDSMQKRSRYICLILLFSVLSILLLVFIDKNNREKQIYDSLFIKLDTKDIEYGSSTKAEELVIEHNGEMNITGELDTSTLGSQQLVFTLSQTEERYGKKVERPYEVSVNVIDTQAPIIELKNDPVYIYVNDRYDPKENINRIYDEIDGEIRTYEIDTDLDTSAKGSYEVKVIATDKNGLKSQTSFTVNVRSVSVSGSEGFEIIHSLLTGSYGYDEAAACGVLANIRFESNFNPDIGDYYYGLCQWGGSRKEALFAYCAENSLDPATIEGQLAYLDYELNSSYPSVKQYLMNVENSEAGAWNAADHFCRYYEGAATSEGRGELAASYFRS